MSFWMCGLCDVSSGCGFRDCGMKTVKSRLLDLQHGSNNNIHMKSEMNSAEGRVAVADDMSEIHNFCCV